MQPLSRALLSGLLPLAGCAGTTIPEGVTVGDRSIVLRPAGVERVQEAEWRVVASDVELRTGTLTGLTGATWVYPRFRIDNRSQQPLLIDFVELVTGGRTYVGQVIVPEDARRRGTPPGTRNELVFGLHFDRPISEAYGDDAVLTLRLQLGGREEAVASRYERDR